MKEKLKKLSKAFEKQAEGLDGIIDALTRTAPTPPVPPGPGPGPEPTAKTIAHYRDGSTREYDLTGTLTYIGNEVETTDLVSIELNGVTSIEYNAFDGVDLDSLSIPLTVTSIDLYYVGGSNTIQNVIFVGRTTEQVFDLFGIEEYYDSTNIGEDLICTNGTIHNGGSEGYYVVTP